MPQFEISYFSQPQQDFTTGELIQVSRPFVPIVLSYKNKNTLPFHALVDSGADGNLFPASWGESVGINIKSGVEKITGGIGDSRIKSYAHKVKLGIMKYQFECEVDFSYEQNFPLLGRIGFFDHFERINFNQNKESIIFRYKG